MSATTIYVVFCDHENPMGCSCCAYSGPEYICESFFSEDNARAWLVEKEKEVQTEFDKDEDPAYHYITEWDEDKTAFEVTTKYGKDNKHKYLYRYFIHTMEVQP